MSSSADNSRLFLALWPSETERDRLAELARIVAGKRAVKAANVHLTLIFLGATSAEQLVCYTQALNDVAVPPLTLTLDRLGYWPKPRILWLGCSHVQLELMAMVLELNRRLTGCGFTPERRPFSPHITLARKFSDRVPSDLPAEPMVWNVDHIVLAESVREASGTHYRVLQRWPKD